MKNRLAAATLAAVGGMAALMLPGASHAATVGYYKGCGHDSNQSQSIIAAGHTPVAVNTLDAASLAPLDALVMYTCATTAFPGGDAIDAAVAKGMALVLDNSEGYGQPSTFLPGSPTFTPSFSCPLDIDIAAGAPIASGIGGSLNNASFDFTGGICGLTGTVPRAQLPAGAVPFITSSDANAVGAFGYSYGNGKVAYSISQMWQQLPGNTSGFTMPWEAAASTYFTNALVWALAGSTQQSCATEGYTGTKLTWCQNICEKGYTGATLNTWIQRWIGKYRDLPYCAAD